jgi:hypothetical protein
MKLGLREPLREANAGPRCLPRRRAPFPAIAFAVTVGCSSGGVAAPQDASGDGETGARAAPVRGVLGDTGIARPLLQLSRVLPFPCARSSAVASTATQRR